jgi:hypothetical protein
MKVSYWFVAWLGLALFLLLAAGCRKDPCADVTCANGGTCLEGTCDCPEGFSGETCEAFASSEFLGTYSGQYGDCFDVPSTHTVEVTLNGGTDTTTQLQLYRLGDYECPSGELIVAASVSLNQLTIPTQVIDCGGITYTFSGSGELQGAVLTINFTNQYDAGGLIREDACVAILEKQP